MLKRIRNLFARRAETSSDEAKTIPSVETGAARAAAARPPDKPAGPPEIHHGPHVVHRPIPSQDLDQDAVKIVRRLTRFDQTAYLVGGCVRDLLLDMKPKDFDVATSATPRQVKRLFSNCRIIGRRFRLAHIFFQTGKIIEVATFRAGNDAETGREEGSTDDLMIRDDNVFGTPEQDALRRDFTINSLFYDVNQETVIDHAGGLDDLRRKLVRTIGDPAIRFREDPIRILRAVKFAARLDFQIEPGTLSALRELRGEIPKAATARVLEEINRFSRGGAARRSFELLRETDVLEVILPEVASALSEGEAWRVAMKLFERMDAARADGREASTGQIFVCLLFPILAPRMGWSPDGRVAGSPRVNLREAADEFLRPMSLRLHVPRRDQEECRQILLTLQRMVPAGNFKRGVREAIVRRPSFSPSLAILDAAAAAYGGEVAEAARFWRELPEAKAPHVHARAEQPSPDDDEHGPRGRRRRRRGGRGRSRAQRPAGERTASERSAPSAARAEPSGRAGAKDPNLPPPWDDRYFFAALPTASSEAGAATVGDRYGAALPAVAPGVSEDEGEAGQDRGEGPGEGRRRRRPRRRGGRSRRSSESGASESADDPGAPGQDEGTPS